jgi:DNA-binding GntR family transcriptional regulator
MSVRLTAEPISPLTLVDRVHQRLWDWILGGRLQPGDWLRIQELARTLKVSDTPIREALIRLQQSGLVETLPHVGTRVRRFTRQDIEESFDLREALECYALQHAAPRVSPATLQRLRQQLKKAETALEAGDTGPAVAADIALHSELIRAAGNSRILSLFYNLLDQVRMFAGFGNRTPEGPRRFLVMHLRIVDLLLKGNSGGAARLMREHMQLAKANAVRGYFGSSAAESEQPRAFTQTASIREGRRVTGPGEARVPDGRRPAPVRRTTTMANGKTSCTRARMGILSRKEKDDE